MLSRRKLLVGAGLVSAGALSGRLLPQAAAGDAAATAEDGGTTLELVAAERPRALPCFQGRTLPLWTFGDDPLPVLRARVGQPFEASVENRLRRPGEHISIHWHGIRLPNAQDGVPYLTQQPIRPGETSRYAFTPPDAGTFFFHTHCNTAEQLGRGLMGVFLVDGDEPAGFDAERVLALRDWTIAEGGDFGPFLTSEAARAGTFGNVRSCNGEAEPELPVPASADVRLRILNVDRTRIMQLGIEGADCAVIAIDGNPVPPFSLKAWFAGPATRIDVAMRSPADGSIATLYDYFSAEPTPLARFVAEGDPVRAGEFDPAPLQPSPIPEPQLETAERLSFAFSATATSQAVAATALDPSEDIGSDDLSLDDLCTAPQTFWAINKQAWPARDHKRIPPPIAILERGRSYVFELRNLTPHMHPIHIHGHTFKVLKSNKRELPVHHADTVLLQAKERVEVAFVADNPGDWMFHCHIIEHQETGMMSYIRVA